MQFKPKFGGSFQCYVHHILFRVRYHNYFKNNGEGRGEIMCVNLNEMNIIHLLSGAVFSELFSNVPQQLSNIAHIPKTHISYTPFAGSVCNTKTFPANPLSPSAKQSQVNDAILLVQNKHTSQCILAHLWCKLSRSIQIVDI